MIDFRIDDIVPCLKEVATGELYDTEVIRIRRKSFLKKFNTRTGWHVNWEMLSKNAEIYALVLSGTMDIQGLVAVQYDSEAMIVHVAWACMAPHNNMREFGSKRFEGVGGHLLAVASELSIRHGYEGYICAEAADRRLYQYYIDEFQAVPVYSLGNPYRFMISGLATARLREVYSYVWTEDIV